MNASLPVRLIIAIILSNSECTLAKMADDFMCTEKCRKVNELYSTDTLISFIEMYKSGNNDTITDYLYKFSELNVDMKQNRINATIQKNIMRARGYISSIDGCTCKSIRFKNDTIKINYGDTKIIQQKPIKFDQQELANINERGMDLYNNNCGEIFFTSKYKIVEIINNPALRFESCGQKHKCGDEEVTTYCVQVTASALSNENYIYPKSNGYRNEVYFDRTMLEKYSNKLEWKMVLENQYGYDTTIVIKTEKRANKR